MVFDKEKCESAVLGEATVLLSNAFDPKGEPILFAHKVVGMTTEKIGDDIYWHLMVEASRGYEIVQFHKIYGIGYKDGKYDLSRLSTFIEYSLGRQAAEDAKRIMDDALAILMNARD